MVENLFYASLCRNCSRIFVIQPLEDHGDKRRPQIIVIERFWPELHSRVNYPLKRCFSYLSEHYNHELRDPVRSEILYFVDHHVRCC